MANVRLLKINETRPFMKGRDLIHGTDIHAADKDEKGADVNLVKVVVPGDYNCLFYSYALGLAAIVSKNEIDIRNHPFNKNLTDAIKASVADLQIIRNMQDQDVNVQQELDRILRDFAAKDTAQFMAQFQQEMIELNNNINPTVLQARMAAWMYIIGVALKRVQLASHPADWDGWGNEIDLNELPRKLDVNVKIYEKGRNNLIQIVKSGNDNPEISLLHSGNHFDFLGQKGMTWDKLPSPEARKPTLWNEVKSAIQTKLNRVETYKSGESAKNTALADRKHVYAGFVIQAATQKDLDGVLAAALENKTDAEAREIIKKFNAEVTTELAKKPKR